MITISADSTYLKIGERSIRKENILMLDRNETAVHVILSGRRPHSIEDGNGIVIPYAEAEVSGHDPFTSAAELQAYIETL